MQEALARKEEERSNADTSILSRKYHPMDNRLEVWTS